VKGSISELKPKGGIMSQKIAGTMPEYEASLVILKQHKGSKMGKGPNANFSSMSMISTK